MKVNTIHLSRLRNDEHFQFHTEIKELIARYGETNLQIEYLFNMYRTIYAKEDAGLKAIRKSSFTALISDADRTRSSLLIGMEQTNTAALRHYSPTVRESATRLKILFDTYGHISHKSYDAKTSEIYNLLQDLNAHYAKDAYNVGIYEWAQQINMENDRFSSLMRDRYDESAQKSDVVLKEVRTKMDDLFNAVSERMNAYVIIEEDDVYTRFIRSMNAVIDRFNDIYLHK